MVGGRFFSFLEIFPAVGPGPKVPQFRLLSWLIVGWDNRRPAEQWRSRGGRALASVTRSRVATPARLLRQVDPQLCAYLQRPSEQWRIRGCSGFKAVRVDSPFTAGYGTTQERMDPWSAICALEVTSPGCRCLPEGVMGSSHLSQCGLASNLLGWLTFVIRGGNPKCAGGR